VVVKTTERGSGRQPPRMQLITVQEHIPIQAPEFGSREIDPRSVRLARVADFSERQENNASIIVDAVPDPPGARDLELPLVEESPAN
jgi:hypothetical protein